VVFVVFNYHSLELQYSFSVSLLRNLIGREKALVIEIESTVHSKSIRLTYTVIKLFNPNSAAGEPEFGGAQVKRASFVLGVVRNLDRPKIDHKDQLED